MKADEMELLRQLAPHDEEAAKRLEREENRRGEDDWFQYSGGIFSKIGMNCALSALSYPLSPSISAALRRAQACRTRQARQDTLALQKHPTMR